MFSSSPSSSLPPRLPCTNARRAAGEDESGSDMAAVVRPICSTTHLPSVVQIFPSHNLTKSVQEQFQQESGGWRA
eukprot:8785464-Pyramimonas_sp.AAC.1